MCTEKETERETQIERDRERERQAYCKELAHVIMAAGKSEICRNWRHREESTSQLKSEGSLLAESPHCSPNCGRSAVMGEKAKWRPLQGAYLEN